MFINIITSVVSVDKLSVCNLFETKRYKMADNFKLVKSTYFGFLSLLYSLSFILLFSISECKIPHTNSAVSFVSQGSLSDFVHFS